MRMMFIVLIWALASFTTAQVHRKEYRPEESEKYIETDLKCSRAIFAVNTERLGKFDSLDMRCVVDAQYFCDYSVKITPGKEVGKPVPTPSDRKNNKKSKLECPSGRPHLIIDGQSPIRNAIFECLNYGEKAVWTVDGNIIDENGPDVYCTDEVQCHQVLTISESSVIDGKLDANLLPACFETGDLLTIDDKNVTDVSCNTKSGDYTYTVDGEVRTIHENTTFHCNYPEDNKIITTDAENLEKIGFTTLYVGGGAAVVLIAGLLSYCGCLWWKDKQLVKKTAIGTGEKRELIRKNKAKSKNQKPSQSSSSEPAELWDWNEMQMSAIQISFDVMAIPGAQGGAVHKEFDQQVYVFDATATVARSGKALKCTQKEEELVDKKISGLGEDEIKRLRLIITNLKKTNSE